MFSRIGTEVTQRPLAKAFVQETHLHFAVDDPKAPKEPDEFDMTITSPGSRLDPVGRCASGRVALRTNSRLGCAGRGHRLGSATDLRGQE